jgi:serine protease AprX
VSRSKVVQPRTSSRRSRRREQVAILLSLVLVLTTFAGVQAAGSWESKVDASVLQDAAVGKADFIVFMADKADLSGAAQLPTKAQKGTFVYNALTAKARESQAGALQVLGAAGAPARSFWIANTIVTRGDLTLIEALASRSDVRAIYAVGTGRIDEPLDRIAEAPGSSTSTTAVSTVGPSLDWVRADEAWALGYRGQGAVVAGADTGVRWTHEALKRQYRGWDAATGTANHDYNWHNGAAVNASCPGNDAEPCDDNEHGTHTVGTMVGDDGAGNQIGMAPDAKWIACRNMNQGFGAVPTYMDCMQWLLAPTRIDGTGADPTKAPDVVNNSWGCVEVCAPPLLKDMVDASRAAGIFYVVSAGNDNQWFLGLTSICENIVFPLAVYQSAFTVGSTGATNDNISDFSSLGPVPDNPSEGIRYRKPDIVAPGDGIRSAVHGSDDAYASLSGTSMAGPHVAGLVALIISANPALRGQVDAIEDIITTTAKPLTTTKGCGGDTSTQVPNNVFGWGRIDALAAVQKALGTTPEPTPTLTPTPTPTPTPTQSNPGCAPSHVYFFGIVYDAEQRADFAADVNNFEYFLSTLRKNYCIPDNQATILAFENSWANPTTGKVYAEASEAAMYAELARLGGLANQHADSQFFFFLSSHGNVWSGALPNSGCPPERLAGSFSALKAGGGQSGDLDDCELGNVLNSSFAPNTRMFVAVDCSFCGGFSDSLTAVSGTIPDDSIPVGAGVVGPNRIVMTGCAMTTECFGSDVAEDGAVSYHHMREVLEGTVSCDGWTVPGFPDIEGFDVPVQGPPFRDLDGRCTASEWFFGAVWSAYTSGDVIGIQQQFRIKYRLPTLADDLLIAGGGPAPQADLTVSAMSASAQKAKAGDRVVVSATITNRGTADSPASTTELRLGDGTVLGAVDTAAIAAGASTTVSATWDTRGANGDYVVTATADRASTVGEGDEANNAANLAVTIRGNKVQNQSFEQPNSAGNGPESWQSGSTGAGTTSYGSSSSSASDGTRSVSISGTGKSVVLSGAPTWTSAPFTVTPGELLTVSVDVSCVRLSSAPSLSLAYLGPAGELLNTVKVLTAPLATTGFATLSSEVQVPLNVTSVRLVLAGFSPTDTRTAGTVIFDNVGVWGE